MAFWSSTAINFEEQGWAYARGFQLQDDNCVLRLNCNFISDLIRCGLLLCKQLCCLLSRTGSDIGALVYRRRGAASKRAPSETPCDLDIEEVSSPDISFSRLLRSRSNTYASVTTYNACAKQAGLTPCKAKGFAQALAYFASPAPGASQPHCYIQAAAGGSLDTARVKGTADYNTYQHRSMVV
jgi:hypothetical protein